MNRWISIQNSEINPNKYAQLAFDTDAKTIQRKRTAFSTNGARAVRHAQAEEINLSECLAPYTKINSNWITDLNMKYKIIKCLENIEE